MSLSRPLALSALLLAAAPLVAQDWKGMGRMEGKVLDSDGKPLAEVTVKLDLPSRGGGPTAKTDKKGKWAVGGIVAGAWNVDFEAPGYATKRVTINLPSEGSRLAPVETRLEKAAPKGPPPELLATLTKGDEAYKAGRYAEARAEYEKVLATKPEFTLTLHEMIARCYSQEGNYAKAVEHLQPLLDADPTNLNIRMLMAQEALRGGMLDKGMELLKGIEEAAVTNPEVLYNIAVLLLNQQKTEEAIVYLTKAVTVDPTFVDGYFQRGLAYIGLQRMAEAKADLRKVIELAPQSAQAETAKKALEQLK